jgi:hypothetical protein
MALLNAADTLAAEFPHLPHAVVYEKVGDARPIAARQLPNVDAYREALKREARVALAGYRVAAWHELSPGTAGSTGSS